MHKKILVTYASRSGSTQAVAQTVGEELVNLGAEVDLRFLLDVKHVENYDAIIIGAPLRSGKWLPEATRFVYSHQPQLRKKSVAYFVVCMTLHNDTPKNQQKVLSALETASDYVKPIDIGLFAGNLNRKNMPSWWGRIVTKLSGLPEGDYRNFPLIRRWGITVGKKIGLD